MDLVSKHGWARRAIIPIYGLDQLLFVVFLVALTAMLGLIVQNRLLWIFLLVGAYVGYVLTMIQSTPTELRLRSSEVADVRSLLDRSPFLRRTGEDSWQKNVDRFRRWDSDDLVLIERINSWVLTGRFIDLYKVKHVIEELP